MQLNTYVGLRAIAYVLNDGTKVIKSGIKRVNTSYDNYYEFLSGQPVSKRVNRRMKAQARRNLWRYKSRRDGLLRICEKHFGCRPQHLTRTENLQLRVKGLSDKLSNQELVNVIMQLQNKRGYKSLRGVSDNDGSDYLREIERHEENIRSYRSLAEYLLTLESSTNVIVTRKTYEAEFNSIMDAQQLDEGLRKKIFDKIYYQRPLKRPKVGRCRYESRDVCHASNPVYQSFRVWRDVHNIVIYDSDGNELDISFEQRKAWHEKCNRGFNLTKASCLKDMGIKKPSEYTWYSGKVIAGNPINKAFADLKVNADYYELWQDIFSATDNDRLARLLSKKYSFSDMVVNALVDLDFNKLGWADFSIKAVKRLTPVMESGHKLKEAILDVYGEVAMTEVALRNVVLEQHFDSYKALVEQLQTKYKITSYQVEIDHLLKQSNKGRKAIAQGKRKDVKFEKQHPELTHYERLKLRLWEESGGVSPYEPDYVIPKEELFTSKYNIDHIVPKSKLYERSIANQVLCREKLNIQKGRMTGIDMAKKLGIEDEYRKAVERFPESKQRYLLMGEEDIPIDWLSRRQNSDYNTRCFASIGGAVNIPNKIINRYTKEWFSNSYDDQDARHYLCKAWVMANMSQKTVDYFDNIRHVDGGGYNIEPDVERIDVENAMVFMPRIKYTRKTKYGYIPRHQLHQESVYGRRVTKVRNGKGEIVEEVKYKIRQPISKLTEAMVGRIMDRATKEAIENRIKEVGSHEAGIASLIERPAMHNNKPIKRVSVAQNAERIFALRSTDGNGITGRFRDHDKKVDYVFSETNYCMRIRVENGKVKRDTISLLEYVNMLNDGRSEDMAFTIQKNDIIELRGKYYFSIGVSEALALRPVHTLSATDTVKLKAEDWLNIHKVEVNQLGEIIRKTSLNGDT